MGKDELKAKQRIFIPHEKSIEFAQNKGVAAVQHGTKQKLITVQIFDPERLISDCLAYCLNSSGKFTAVSSGVPTTTHIYQSGKLNHAKKIHFHDVFILRGKIAPGLILTQLASEIKRVQPKSKIIFIIPDLNSADIDFAIEFGAHGVVDGEVNVARLGHIIEFVCSDETYVPMEYVLERMRDSMGVIIR